jgi:hypothetical protein
MLAADWDIVNSITITLQQLALTLVYQHVLGHQDNKVLYDALPLDAQLNCDTDLEAAYHQLEHAKSQLTMPRISSNKA